MTLSDEAWEEISSTYEKIWKHPFIQEMSLSSLSENRFIYYMQQDLLYLRDYAECSMIIAQSIKIDYKEYFINQSLSTMQYIEFAESEYAQYKSNITSRATEGYMGHLMKSCKKSVDIAVAAMLPCEWIYKELGNYLLNNSVDSNIYAAWFIPLTDEEYISNVHKLIEIFDDLSLSSENQDLMLNIFNKSAIWEQYFFDDAYNEVGFYL
jgi:thiaminase (transcriptional activator TenA)